jgi:KTSC domain
VEFVSILINTMRKLFLLFASCALFIASSNSQTNCNQLKTHFSTYVAAINAVKSSSFKIQETLNTSKSSWIRSASYYSCDGQTGYLIIKTDEKEYIHYAVPIVLWKQFKEADSFGSFYDYYLKNRYHFSLNK